MTRASRLREVSHPVLLGWIVLVSAAMLFLELVLIRWGAAEVRIFAYMHNLLLVATFFGIGLGCYQATQPVRWTRGLVALLLLTLLVTDPLRLHIGEIITQGIAVAEDSVLWSVRPSLHAAATVPVSSLLLMCSAVILTMSFLVLTVLSLEPFGQVLGTLMEQHPQPLVAYSANLLGSLIGTWGFFLCSAMLTGPVFWFVMVACLSAPLLFWKSTQSRRTATGRLLLLVAPIAVVALAASTSTARGVVTLWSPYQKLEISPLYLPPKPGVEVWEGAPIREQAGYLVQVNNVFYQSILNLSERFRAQRPDVYRTLVFSHYDLPYRVVPTAKRVLVVGAGTGNDVAAALRHGAQQVDAVEIDPEILSTGIQLHPEHPYEDPRVHTVVADARSFFKRGRPQTYDLIWFGLLDSHTTASGYTTLRLDHYVYTRESFAEARRLLRPDGLIVCVFATRRAWIGDRISGLLNETFGVPPISVRVPRHPFSGVDNEVFFAGSPAGLQRIRMAVRQDPMLAQFFHDQATQHPRVTRLTTDDWPYLYLHEARIPTAYALMSGLILLLVACFQRPLLGGRSISWPFFFLGAAFLLLEVLGVSRAALLFGATWVVTAIVISGVLTMAILANLWVTWRPTGSLWGPFIGILVSGIMILWVPLRALSVLGPVAKMIATGSFFAAPLFFSGVLFARLFEQAPSKGHALGSNLFGALVGGLCEQASFVFGLRALTVFALVLYAAALLSLRGQTKGRLFPHSS